MSQDLVVGIFPGSDPTAIETALTGQQVDLSKVKVVLRGSAGDDAAEESQIDFIDVAESMETNSLSDDMTKRMGIMGDSGGTGVPGLGASNAKLSSFNSQAAAAKSYLSALAIPLDEVDNFNSAIEDGRAVIAYPDAGADTNTVAAAFKAAGLRNVRTY